jgi:hypothetical protein
MWEVRLGREYRLDGDGDVGRVAGDTDETVPVERGCGTGIFRVVKDMFLERWCLMMHKWRISMVGDSLGVVDGDIEVLQIDSEVLVARDIEVLY